MRYSFLRLLLVEREMPSMLTEMKKGHVEDSREEYLKKNFAEEFQFEARRSPYRYVYIGQEGSVLLGRVGREKLETVNLPPERAFDETDQARWHVANFLLDVSHHEDGQKIAFEGIHKLGNPLTIVRGMAERINSKNPEARWETTANTITEAQEFWDAVDEHKGKITEMELSFVAPNLLGGHEKLKESLKTLHEENNMQTTDIKLRNSEGKLEPDSTNVRESLIFIGEGGGNARLKVGRKTIYNSKERAKKELVKDEENFPLVEKTKSRWSSLIEKLFGNS